jgi:pyruvate,water dikinase
VHPFRDLCIADVPTVGGKVGICGEAPSNYREFAAWLADAGIDSMSLNPDALAGVARTLARTTHTTAIAERALR